MEDQYKYYLFKLLKILRSNNYRKEFLPPVKELVSKINLNFNSDKIITYLESYEFEGISYLDKIYSLFFIPINRLTKFRCVSYSKERFRNLANELKSNKIGYALALCEIQKGEPKIRYMCIKSDKDAFSCIHIRVREWVFFDL